jgi:hypothetical protein
MLRERSGSKIRHPDVQVGGRMVCAGYAAVVPPFPLEPRAGRKCVLSLAMPPVPHELPLVATLAVEDPLPTAVLPKIPRFFQKIINNDNFAPKPKPAFAPQKRGILFYGYRCYYYNYLPSSNEPMYRWVAASQGAPVNGMAQHNQLAFAKALLPHTKKKTDLT